MWQRNTARIIGIAAAVALFIFVWQSWQPASLYDQYAQHKSLALAERGADQVDPTSIENAFAQKRYAEAIPLLEVYRQAYPNSTEASLYQGICYLETNAFEKSDAIFQAIANGESTFKYDGLWYLSLSAIKQKNLEKAKGSLRAIPEDSGYFQKAQNLLKEINNQMTD